MIAIIDYGAGNLRSVRSALDFIGCENIIASSTCDITSADGVILPGVGEFGSAMKEMERRELTNAVKAAAVSGKPFLGICAGMQLLFDTSEESPCARGLGLISGSSSLFPASASIKVPHMGWNSIKTAKTSRLLGAITGEPYMYFVHSYYVRARDGGCVSATCEYGGTHFDAAVEKENLFGCQFHPEKSGEAGLSILRRFAEIAEGAM